MKVIRFLTVLYISLISLVTYSCSDTNDTKSSFITREEFELAKNIREYNRRAMEPLSDKIVNAISDEEARDHAECKSLTVENIVEMFKMRSKKDELMTQGFIICNHDTGINDNYEDVIRSTTITYCKCRYNDLKNKNKETLEYRHIVRVKGEAETQIEYLLNNPTQVSELRKELLSKGQVIDPRLPELRVYKGVKFNFYKNSWPGKNSYALLALQPKPGE